LRNALEILAVRVSRCERNGTPAAEYIIIAPLTIVAGADIRIW